MRERFSQMFRLRQGEANLVLALGFALFINDVTMGISKVVSVSGFLSKYNDYYILPVWAVDMALLVLATGFQSLVIDRFHRLKLFGGITLGLVILYGLLSITFSINNFPLQASYTLLYLLTDQQWLIFPLIFWILVNDIFDPAQARRLFPLIGTFAFVGTIAGLLVAQLDAFLGFGPVKLLIFNSIVSLLATIIVFTTLRKTAIRHNPQESVSISQALSGGWLFIRDVPAFRYLSLSMVAAGVTLTILLYDTLSDASLQFGDHFQSFYALYSLVIAVVSILIQFLSGKIIEKLGLKDSFLVLPFTMLISSVANFFVPGFISSASTQGFSRVIVQTVDQSSRKSFQAMVPAEKRGRVSLFIDSYLPSLGTIVGSLITYGIIWRGVSRGIARQTFTSYYLGVAIVAALVAVTASLLMRSVYDQSMFNWQLKRRSRGSSVMDKLDFSDSDKK
jgi:ATP:ADP antiporter, AAA family